MENRRLEDLVSLWYRNAEQGKTVAPEDICPPDTPELLPELRKRIDALKKMNKLVGQMNNQSTTVGTFTPELISPPKPVAIPSVNIPGYEILAMLGRGGMGVVYKARHLQLDRIVALKMILAGSHASQADLQRFHTEAKAIAQLQHPNIVQVFDVGEYEDKPYFSMEFCGGGSLDRRLRGTPLPPREAAGLVETLSRAMHYAHQRQVIHRDLKPGNILLLPGEEGTGEVTAAEKSTQPPPSQTTLPQEPRPSGSKPAPSRFFPKITDFGLAKKLDQEAGQTHTGAVMGTPSYMAPEQASGQTRNVTPAADIYALGAILYECLTGRPPFRAATTMDTLWQVLHEDPVPPRRLQPTTAKDLDTVCLKCLQKDPKKRYASAADLAEDLRRFQTGEPIQARPISPPERLWRACRRNPRVAALISLLIVVVTASFISLMWLYRLSEEDRTQAVVLKKKAEDAQQEAEQEARKAQEVSHFLLGLFESSDPVGLQGYSFGPTSGGSAQLTSVELLKRATEKLKNKQFKTAPLIQAAQMDTIGNVYRALGLHVEAEDLLDSAYKLRKQHLGENHPDVGDSLNSLGWLYHQRGQYPKAKDYYEKALAIRKKAGEDHSKVTATLLNLSWLLGEMGDYARAEELIKDVIARRLKQYGNEPHRDVGIAYVGLAALYLETGKFTDAIKPAADAITIFNELGTSDNLTKAVGLFQEAVVASFAFKQHSLAEEKLRKCVELITTELGDNHVYLAIATFQLGAVLREQNKFDEAERYLRQCYKIARSTVGLAHPKITVLAYHLGSLLDRKKLYRESQTMFDDILAAHKERFGPSHPLVADVLLVNASLLADREAYQSQAEALSQAINIYQQSGTQVGKHAKRFKSGLRSLSICYWRLKSATKGLEVGLQRQKVFADDPKELFDTACELALLMPVAQVDTSLPIQDRQQFAQQCAFHAVRTLDMAIAQGFKDAVLLKAEPRLQLLEGRKDYEALFQKVPGADWNKVTIIRDRLSKQDRLDKVNKNCRSKVFPLKLEEGKTYQVDLMSLDFDPYLRIENSSGQQLAVNDDRDPSVLDSQLLFRPNQTGVYHLIVTTFHANQTGAFSLVVRPKD